MVTIGFDRQCITPTLPTALSGYAKERIAYEVHDDLYARCLAMEHLGTRYLLVQCDLIGIDDSVLNAVFDKIIDLYAPLIEHHCYINGKFDEDLHQYILMRIALKIRKFNI